MFSSIAAALIGFAVTLLLTVLVLKMARRYPFGIDSPDPFRKLHERPVPRVGGLAIFLSFLVLCWVLDGVGLKLPQPFLAIIVGAGLIFVLGFTDDLHALSPWMKLIGQLGIALLVWTTGLRSEPVAGGHLFMGLVVTLLWLIAIPNVVNLTDGMDGLAGALGISLLLTLGIAASFGQLSPGYGFLSFGLVGSLSAFLLFNLPPSRLFLGDGGAYLIGFFVAAAPMLDGGKSGETLLFLTIIVATGLPILDTLFSVVRRWLRGSPVMKGDTGHVHHRLQKMGLTQQQALLVLCAVFLVQCLVALLVLLNDLVRPWMGVAFLMALAVIVLRLLGFVETWRTLVSDLLAVTRSRKRMRQACRISQRLIGKADKIQGEQFWIEFAKDLEKVGFSLQQKDEAVEVSVPVPEELSFTWTIWDVSKVPGLRRRTRRSIARCFVEPLADGIRRNGRPPWAGLTFLSQRSPGFG